MSICLLPDKIEEFKKALKEKDIRISDLINMDSSERTKLFEKYAGENAKDVNLLFEEKLILKNRMIGLKNLFSKITESGRYGPEGKAKLERALSEYRASQQERVFSPKDNQSFLSNLAEKMLGTEISKEEAKNVFDLSNRLEQFKKGFDKNRPYGEGWDTPENKANYGAAKLQYEAYISELKGEGEPFKEVIKGRLQEFKNTAKTNPVRATTNLGLDALKAISDNSIAVVASVDNSFLGRQGLKTLLTHPSAWWPAARDSFSNIYKELGGKDAMSAILSDYYSRENNLNGEYQKSGIIPGIEEQYPTSLPERIPGLGRVFKASEVAFKGTALRMRMDLYDLQREMQREQGLDMKDPNLIKDTGSVTNSLTARGKYGKYGESPIVKLLLWAPRMLKSHYDVLTAHSFGGALETPWARKQAALNATKIIGSIGLTLMIAKAMNRNSVESDPTSSNFGRIVVDDTKISRIIGAIADFVGISSNSRYGKTTFDLTGGMNSLVTLAARQLEGASKSSSSGVKTPFGSGFGETSRFQSFIDFLTGKTSPTTKVVIDFGKGQNINGQPPVSWDELGGITIPISVQNVLGIFSPSDQAGSNWNMNTSAELQQFKDKIGDKQFQKANQDYNVKVNTWLKDVQKNPTFTSLSADDQKRAITSKKAEFKKQIFSSYGFKYNSTPSKKLPKF